jgi:hypothetical protein
MKVLSPISVMNDVMSLEYRTEKGRVRHKYVRYRLNFFTDLRYPNFLMSISLSMSMFVSIFMSVSCSHLSMSMSIAIFELKYHEHEYGRGVDMEMIIPRRWT